MSSAKKVLVVSPHCDDETIGMGGTIARHAAQGDEVSVYVVTGHGEGRPYPMFKEENIKRVRGEASMACQILGVKDLVFTDLPAAGVSTVAPWHLNKTIGDMIVAMQPDILYVPFLNDLHRDHREIFHALSVAWRSSSMTGRNIEAIYCYEVQSETHWNFPYVEAGFLPNHWVDITDYLDQKIEALKMYKSQVRDSPDARSIEAIRSLAVWRGSLQGMHAAESFVTVRTLR